jgi:hypothetical protein
MQGFARREARQIEDKIIDLALQLCLNRQNLHGNKRRSRGSLRGVSDEVEIIVALDVV